MHQPGGQCAQRSHLLLLNRRALHPLEAFGHVPQNGLAHIRTRGHQAPEALFVELHQVAGILRPHVNRVGDIREKRKLAKGVSAGNRGNLHLAPVRHGLREQHAAFKQNPEVVSSLSLAHQKVAFFELDLLQTLQAAQLLLFERGKDRRCSQLCKESIADGRCGGLLDDWGLLAHGCGGIRPFRVLQGIGERTGSRSTLLRLRRRTA